MTSSAQLKKINLALQGGGSHGAFTWGVLDKLLEDGRLAFDAISGTSAGAMNAVVMTHGFHRGGGNDGARAALESFWQGVSKVSEFSPIRRSPLDMLMGSWSLDHSIGYLAFDMMSRLLSPYELNPANINPLRDLLAEQVDFEHLKECNEIKLFISATNVHTGRARVFERHELTLDMVMASACLPFMFQAVEIDGVPYWDGGYMGNPVLYPFFYKSASRDVLIVHINPIERHDTPNSAQEILNRVNEITFNSSLLNELRAVDFVARLLEEGNLDTSRYRKILVHRIAADNVLNSLGASSKLNAEWDFFVYLRDLGRQSAADRLRDHFNKIGHESSIDIKEICGGSEGIS